jgi:hypothetical protein
MKLITTLALAAVTMVSLSSTASAEDDHYKDLYELKELHAAFHKAVSHAGINATTKAQALTSLLELWTDDGVLIVGDVVYSTKGTPGTASCEPGTQTLCDFYNNHAGGLVLGHDWVSLTPIFTESINLIDRQTAEIYFQCIYFDVNNNDVLKSNVTFGLPDMPHTALATKVHGHWLFAFAESAPVTPPTLDVY